MEKTLLPKTILSARVCLCEFYPDTNILWEGSQKKKQTYSKKLEISNMIVVKGGDSSGKSVSRCDPTESEANEEAHGPPAESVRL